ncbi:MAG: lysylphosphatidylglycerol synthase transmembrane domain-containing protein [Paludibacter sp.]|nr:lysylphosphatidylglycerol synthase transmembrane domain-containing protein [Paludibacter sp.]
MKELTINKSGNSPFKLSQILIPIAIGMVVVLWLFLVEFDPKTLNSINFTLTSVAYILLSFLLMLGRDFGMIWRFRLMTDKDLTWKQSFDIHILSEFTSAVTPSAVGGSGLVFIFMNKEGISLGRSTTIMFTSLIMDELYFIIICPIIFLMIQMNELFNATSVIASTISIVFWTVYSAVFIWTLILYLGLFHRPDLIAKLLKFVFRLSILRKWHPKITQFAENIIESSNEIRKKSIGFWMKITATTILTWSSRFLVVNALFMAFIPVENHLIIFGRQLLLWMVMLVSPSPGGSGLSEYAFKEYYNDIILGSGPVLIIIVLWRLISYYLYLFLGVLILPRWLTKKFK